MLWKIALVPAEDPGPEEDLCNGLELHLPYSWDFLDPVPRDNGDAQVFQQSPKPAGGDWSFSPEGLHLVRISVHPLDLCVTQGRVLLVGLVFYVDVMVLLLLLLSR
jgi:hypothetical protein